jgi:multidrug efflux pump subunit AcrB
LNSERGSGKSEVQRTDEKQSPDITMVVHLVSPDGSLDSVFTRNYALLQIRDELARLEGVGDINVFGAREYAMRIWLDPNKVAARGLTARDAVQAIQEQNVQIAAGIVGAQPVPKGAAAFQYTVNTQGRLTVRRRHEALALLLPITANSIRFYALFCAGIRHSGNRVCAAELTYL